MVVASYRWAYFVVTGAIILSACAKPAGPHQPLPKPSMGTSQMIGFEQILPIVRLRCSRCHNEGENDWTQEVNLRRVAKSGAMALRLNTHTMPQEGSPESLAITEKEREVLVQWAEHVAIGKESNDTNTFTEE